MNGSLARSVRFFVIQSAFVVRKCVPVRPVKEDTDCNDISLKL